MIPLLRESGFHAKIVHETSFCSVQTVNYRIEMPGSVTVELRCKSTTLIPSANSLVQIKQRERNKKTNYIAQATCSPVQSWSFVLSLLKLSRRSFSWALAWSAFSLSFSESNMSTKLTNPFSWYFRTPAWALNILVSARDLHLFLRSSNNHGKHGTQSLVRSCSMDALRQTGYP